jgi:hypothetical protein
MIRVKDLLVRKGTFQRVFQDPNSRMLSEIGEVLNDALTDFHKYHAEKLKELGLNKPPCKCEKWNPWMRRRREKKVEQFDRAMEEYAQKELIYPPDFQPIPLSALDGLRVSAIDVAMLRQLNVIAR